MNKSKLMKITAFLSFLSVVLIFMSCGGGGGGGGTNGTGDNGTGENQGDTIKYQGFNFSLNQGDFLEYGWDYYYSSSSGSSSSFSDQAGAFRITLGAPVTIGGVNFYAVNLTGITGAKDASDESYSFAPRWKYIAIDNNKVLGSTDGVQTSVIFDAGKGYWAGGGFIKTFPSDKLIQATGPTSLVTNDYITSSDALKVSESFNQSECEYYPGIGTICGDESHDYIETEYFIPNVGLALYYYYNSAFYEGGGVYSGVTWIKHVGLVASSLRGDTVDYLLENEPNDSPSAAQAISNNAKIRGYVMRSKDSSTSLTLTLNSQIHTVPIHDWFAITITPPIEQPLRMYTVTINLDFTGCTSATDLDLFLFNSLRTSDSSLKGYSIADNQQTGTRTESIQLQLGRGTYYIGVSGWSIDSANSHATAKYYLTTSWY
jgi:hypothetical protein